MKAVNAMTVILKHQEIVFIVLIDVFVILINSEKYDVSLVFRVYVKKRDKSIDLCYSAVRNTDLQI